MNRIAAAFLSSFLLSTPALGFVSTPVGGHPGELDLNLQFTAERGKTEPTENQDSWFKPEGFHEYKLGAGYTFGDLGPLEFFALRLEGTFFQSPEEVSDPDKFELAAPGAGSSGVPGAGECTAGAEYLGDGVCQFYSADEGGIATATVSFAVIHDAKFALGLFVRGQVPIGMDLDKFANPRLDYFALGSQVGVDLKPWLLYESSIYLGSGTRPFGEQQNGAFALTNLFHLRARSWLLPWKAGLKLGPYLEVDIHERHDARYDAAYSPIALAAAGEQPSQSSDRIRAVRVATAILPYFLVTEHLAVELGYIQKFFGYDARATQVYFLGLRGLFALRE